MIKIKCFYFNEFRECCQLIWDETGEGVIVDPGCGTGSERSSLYEAIGNNGIKPVKILLTHAHFDHVLGLQACVDRYGIPVFMHPAEKETLRANGAFSRMFGIEVPEISAKTTDIADGDVIKSGNTSFEVLYTPGHTPGGVCYYDRADKLLISGDTLFAGTIGRTDQPGGDYDRLMESIRTKLLDMDGDVTVIPGHGPTTTIADERTKNPFLVPFNFPNDEGEE